MFEERTLLLSYPSLSGASSRNKGKERHLKEETRFQKGFSRRKENQHPRVERKSRKVVVPDSSWGVPHLGGKRFEGGEGGTFLTGGTLWAAGGRKNTQKVSRKGGFGARNQVLSKGKHLKDSFKKISSFSRKGSHAAKKRTEPPKGTISKASQFQKSAPVEKIREYSSTRIKGG